MLIVEYVYNIPVRIHRQENVVADTTHGLGAASVNCSRCVFQIIETVFAFVVRLGKVLKIGQQE